jgi:hypothetical protein
MILINITCVSCNETRTIEVDPVGYTNWKNGQLIQRAMPELSAEDREMLISRICPDCWNKLFPED